MRVNGKSTSWRSEALVGRGTLREATDPRAAELGRRGYPRLNQTALSLGEVDLGTKI